MRNKPFILIVLYCFFLLTGSVYGIGEKTITMGSSSSWELMEKRQGVAEALLIRPNPVLVLAGQPYETDTLLDSPLSGQLELRLSFDEGLPLKFADSLGRYEISVSPELTAVSAPWSRIGNGAALFSKKSGSNISEEPLVLTPRRNALFAPGSHIRDFSIEFWLYPQNLETGEQVFSLVSEKSDGRGAYFHQRLQCTASKNRLNWTFSDFFFAPGEKERKSLSLSGPPLLNRVWSHHLIRFDADLGLLEYLVDGRVEAIEYATSSGREDGEVYTPVIGEDCHLSIGSRFSGLVDEFRIYRSCLEKSMLAKYPAQGGRAESRTLDLGSVNSRLIKIEAFGGRTGVPPGRNEYTGNGLLSFSDHTEMKFYIRISNSPYNWNDVPWIPVAAGRDLPEDFRGRYIQVASDFYPGENGETSPYLSELRVIYYGAEAPPPPTHVFAAAKNGAVELSWKASPSNDVGGYMVYYGNARGEYFGDHAMLESAVRVSPINVGNRTQVRIEGLDNGVLYYFAVAAYNKPAIYNAEPGRIGFEPGRMVLEPGEFSREAAARPLPGSAEDSK